MKKVVLSVVLCLLAVVMLGACASVNEDPAQDNLVQNDVGQPDADMNDAGMTDYDNGNVAEQIGRPSVFGEFTAKDLKGNAVTQDIFAQNKLTMVNIWATFCGPCINEMPELGELAAEYKDKGVGVVGIPVDITDEKGNIDDYLFDEAVDIVASTKADYVHVVPTESMFVNKLAAVITVPETIFVDSQGNQVGDSYLGARSKEQWTEIIEELLGEVQ